jgi:1,4-dihydroxy-2-naphthoyl-CoA hydrolase
MTTQDFAEMIERVTDGWKTAMGLHFVSATVDEVVAELEVSDVHRQPLGIVHGGVYAGMIEATASVGASLYAMQADRYAIGLDNHTSFLHAVREGKLRATARPVMRGGKTHLWDADVVDATGRRVATGRVRLIVIERGSQLGGETAQLHVPSGPGSR